MKRRRRRAQLAAAGLLALTCMACLGACGGTPAPTGPISQNQAETDGYNALVADGVKNPPTTLQATLLSTATTKHLLGLTPGVPTWLVVEVGPFEVPIIDADDPPSSLTVAAVLNSRTGKVLTLMWPAPQGYAPTQ